MKSRSHRLVIGFFSAVFFLLGSFAHGQTPAPSTTPAAPRPLLQDIQVYRPQQTEPAATQTATTPSLVKKTASINPSSPYAASTLAAIAEIEIPGYSGVLVETLDGTPIIEYGSTAAYNPASNVKIATAYAVLKTFGPGYRFPTNVWTDGTIDRETATLRGNLYVSGRDPVFAYEHAVSIANELNRLGIRTIEGDLIVTDDFAMSYSGSASRTSRLLFNTLNAALRPAAATREWLAFVNNSGQAGRLPATPSVSFTGSPMVQPLPSSLGLLFTHESPTMRDIVKATLCYSNNFLAERLGDMLGGPSAVARIVQLNASVPASEFYIQTSSGLGVNRVTPSAMMKLLRAFRRDLAQYRMTFADVMPVAGLDEGTLEERFASDFSKGSVVGKTGTLGNTDGGVSALSGEISTRSGRFLFVIFNQRGSVARFRSFQNFYVGMIQGALGGAVPMNYSPVPLEMRLAGSRVVYPQQIQTAAMGLP
ncbi:MAG: D-alanyl-D-alanine carboxypeptidase [Pyrinomonadaceae bacterium]